MFGMIYRSTVRTVLYVGHIANYAAIDAKEYG